MLEEDLKFLLESYNNTESEIIEFKEWKNSIPFSNNGKKEKDNKKCVYGYCVGIGNEGGGKLIIGVNNKGKIIGTTANLKNDAKQWIYSKTGQKLDIEEVNTVDGKVIIINIPSRRNNELLKFNGVPLMRVDDGLTEMNDTTIKKILNESNIDWSAIPCKGTDLESLDNKAIDYLREKLSVVKKNNKWLKIPLINLLNSIGLLTDDIPNNTCILFLGKIEISNKYINERNKISWKYIDTKNGIEERMTLDEQKVPLILTLDRIKYNINRFNTYLKDIDLFRTEIRQYDEKETVEELLINSLVHRDWNILFWNEIVQTPISLEFRNPGLFRADLEKVLKENQSIEYLNPTMADFFVHLNLMERERGGLQKAFNSQLRKGTNIRLYQRDDRVDFRVSGIIENEDFAKLVLQNTEIVLDNLLLLDKISSNNNTIGIDLDKDEAYNLKKEGYIEIRGTRTQKCYISVKLSKIIGKTGSYIRNKGVKTQKKYDLVLQHIDEIGKIQLSDLRDMFPELTLDQCKKIFVNMKRKELIELKKIGGRSNWYYIRQNKEFLTQEKHK